MRRDPWRYQLARCYTRRLRSSSAEDDDGLRALQCGRAQTVDDQLVGAMRRQGIEGPWAAGERILVLGRRD